MARIPAYRITEAQWLTIIGGSTQVPNALYFVEVNDWLVRVYETDNAGTPNPRVVASMQHRGAYNAGTDYLYGDVVEQDGSTWFLKVETSTGNAPPTLPTTSNTQWELLAKKGTDGIGSGGYGLPVGGVQYDLLVKQSGTDGDGDWNSVSAIPFIRYKLTAAITIYVNGSTGSDSNDGLSSGAAFATLQKGINTALGYDNDIWTIVISVAAGTYTETIVINGNGNTKIAINGAGHATTEIAGNVTVQFGCAITFRDIAFATPSSVGLWARYGAVVYLRDDIRLAGGSARLVGADHGAYIEALGGNIYLDADSAFLLYIQSGGEMFIGNTTIYTTAARSYSIVVDSAGLANLIITSVNVTWDETAGSITGQRYRVKSNAVLDTLGGGASFIPGTVAGVEQTGGVYL